MASGQTEGPGSASSGATWPLTPPSMASAGPLPKPARGTVVRSDGSRPQGVLGTATGGRGPPRGLPLPCYNAQLFSSRCWGAQNFREPDSRGGLCCPQRPPSSSGAGRQELLEWDWVWELGWTGEPQEGSPEGARAPEEGLQEAAALEHDHRRGQHGAPLTGALGVSENSAGRRGEAGSWCPTRRERRPRQAFWTGGRGAGDGERGGRAAWGRRAWHVCPRARVCSRCLPSEPWLRKSLQAGADPTTGECGAGGGGWRPGRGQLPGPREPQRACRTGPEGGGGRRGRGARIAWRSLRALGPIGQRSALSRWPRGCAEAVASKTDLTFPSGWLSSQPPRLCSAGVAGLGLWPCVRRPHVPFISGAFGAPKSSRFCPRVWGTAAV